KSKEVFSDFTFLYTGWFYCVHLLGIKLSIMVRCAVALSVAMPSIALHTIHICYINQIFKANFPKK
ncbi:hypothetical protein QHH03_16320, partial [Aphanizomenon sp. 202]|nr:hypothetical protein [Aphanizomenon sp. 202]